MRRALLALATLAMLLISAVALAADEPGTDQAVAQVTGRGDDAPKATPTRAVPDDQILETSVRYPVLPAARVLIGR